MRRFEEVGGGAEIVECLKELIIKTQLVNAIRNTKKQHTWHHSPLMEPSHLSLPSFHFPALHHMDLCAMSCLVFGFALITLAVSDHEPWLGETFFGFGKTCDWVDRAKRSPEDHLIVVGSQTYAVEVKAACEWRAFAVLMECQPTRPNRDLAAQAWSWWYTWKILKRWGSCWLLWIKSQLVGDRVPHRNEVGWRLGACSKIWVNKKHTHRCRLQYQLDRLRWGWTVTGLRIGQARHQFRIHWCQFRHVVSFLNPALRIRTLVDDALLWNTGQHHGGGHRWGGPAVCFAFLQGTSLLIDGASCK